MCFSSKGTGDIYIKAESGMIVSEIYELEDCIFYDATEKSVTKGSSTLKQLIYNDLSLTLPSKFEWTVDMKVNSTNGNEARLFLAQSTYTASTDQPSYGLFLQYGTGANANGGSRRTGSTYSTTTKSISANTYYNFKASRDGTTINYNVDDTSLGSLTENWIDSYNYHFSVTLWKSTTFTWKNMKIKAL